MLSISIRKEFLYFIAIIISIVYLFIQIKKNYRSTGKLIETTTFLRLAMFLYIIILVGVTLFPIVIPPATEIYRMDFVNLDIRNLFQYNTARSFFINILGNILLFVPLVPLIQLNLKHKHLTIYNAITFSLFLSILIEGIQYLENIWGISDFPIRITDINDVLLNFIGGIIGYIFIKTINKYFCFLN